MRGNGVKEREEPKHEERGNNVGHSYLTPNAEGDKLSKTNSPQPGTSGVLKFSQEPAVIGIIFMAF